MVTKTGPTEFAINRIYKVVVRSVAEQGASVFFEDFPLVRGFIHVSQLSYDRVDDARHVIKPGETVYAKILPDRRMNSNMGYPDQNMDVRDNDTSLYKKDFSFRLTLRDLEKPEQGPVIDEPHLEVREEDDIVEFLEHKEKPKEKQEFLRNVIHPLFKNINAIAAEEELAELPVGSALVCFFFFFSL